MAERPWLFGKGIGVDPVAWSAKDFKDWLPAEVNCLGNVFGGGRVSEAPDRWEASVVIPLLEEAFAYPPAG